MAKDLPYFKFFCSEWNDGDITLEDYEIQGLFINICSYYWSNECEVKMDKLFKKFRHVEVSCIDTLLNSGVMKINGEYLCITFLDEQLKERGKLSNQNSINAKKRWEDKRKESESNAIASIPQSDNSTENMQYREEERREEKRREEKKIEKEFNIFWDVYPTKTAKKNCLAKWHRLNDKDIEKILSTIKNYVAYKPFKDYTHPMPMTYLNQERWNDEIKVNGKVLKSKEETKDLITYHWSVEGRNNKRTIHKDKAEAYFKNRAEGGYHAIIL